MGQYVVGSEAYKEKLARNAIWRANHKEHLQEYNRRRNKLRWQDPEFRKQKHADGVRLLYGLVDYDALLKTQLGVCAICGSPPKTRRLAVDHNHQTGEVRGLLCASCNGKLAWFENRRQKIEEYLW